MTMTEVQMQMIAGEGRNMSPEDAKRIMQMIHRYNPDVLNFKQDGCRIILNKLPDKLINEIYNFIQYKIVS
jgi:hypothetical protein